MFLTSTPSHPTATDEELAARYRETGNLVLLGELYARYLHLTYGVCYQYLREPAASQDAVMALFEKLVTELRKHEVHQFSGWLYATARNYCLMQLRAAKTARPQALAHLTEGADMEISDPLHHQELAAMQEAELQALQRGLAGLPDAQQRCLRLFYLDNKSYREVAVTTGLDLNHVKSALQNGRRTLRRLLTGKAA